MSSSNIRIAIPDTNHFIGQDGLIAYANDIILPFKLREIDFDIIEQNTILKADNDSFSGRAENNSERIILTLDLGSVYLIKTMAFWNHNSNSAVSEFELFADEDNIYEMDPDKSFLLSDVERANTVVSIAGVNYLEPAIFSFSPVSTRYVHFSIIDDHSNFSTFRANLGQIVFEAVPFEFGSIPGVILIVTVVGINYFRTKKDDGKDK